MTTLALTYDEIAQRLGITTASARRLVQRKRWPKSKGNDHRAVIQVPAEFFERRQDNRQDSPSDTANDNPSDSPTVTELLTRLAAAQVELVETSARLGQAEGAVATLRETLQCERARADEALQGLRLAEAEAAYVPALRTTVEVLKQALAGEKERLAEVRAERNRLATRRSWWPFRRAG
jgi:hypothetical protein